MYVYIVYIRILCRICCIYIFLAYLSKNWKSSTRNVWNKIKMEYIVGNSLLHIYIYGEQNSLSVSSTC